MEIRASLRRRPDGGWTAHITKGPVAQVDGETPEACLEALERALASAGPRGTRRPGEVTLVVETLPELAGVAEAAEVMGWDKRRVITYLDRGRFPAPVQALASGRVWVRADIERYAADWHARRRARRSGAPREARGGAARPSGDPPG